ncbi:pyrimidine 5'-nucleotidase [Marinomonas pollencensis]|uniref:5'-nucleotidase n=1 Tax=Marinomonas pollencensis TaxID=491954 RepID=A0A3E0DRH4_9GAMM|nr:pyrimidine 5'-nucleotidase [Marinomonas pollencensis]REG85720.1 5'-nucleotidase [Marinomonas pollencensis]
MNYDWIIFDADETLFRFDNFSGLKHMLAKYGVDFNENDFEEYQAINKPLWVEYQNGAISAKQLQTRRFESWSKRLNTSSEQLNHQFLESMGEICEPLPGAKALMTHLSEESIKSIIITNGFTQLQKVRLERTRFDQYFPHVIISEEVGVAKPHLAIFDHALNKIGNPDRKKVLMVGDTLESDILGGINAKLDTCWLNHHNKTHPEHIKPTYQVNSLHELLAKLKQSRVN